MRHQGANAEAKQRGTEGSGSMNETDWTPQLVEAFLIAAVGILRRLPAHRVPGYYNTWPEILRDAWESSRLSDAPSRPASPSPRAIDQMDGTLLWLRWLD